MNRSSLSLKFSVLHFRIDAITNSIDSLKSPNSFFILAKYMKHVTSVLTSPDDWLSFKHSLNSE